VIYLLDTSACVQLLTGKASPTLSRLQLETVRTQVFVSTVVLFELWYGVYHSERVPENRSRAERLLSMGVEFRDFSPEDAEVAGRIRAMLEARKEPIGPYDTLIAGRALARKYTLVTANRREFARIEGLLWEDWAQAPA